MKCRLTNNDYCYVVVLGVSICKKGDLNSADITSNQRGAHPSRGLLKTERCLDRAILHDATKMTLVAMSASLLKVCNSFCLALSLLLHNSG